MAERLRKVDRCLRDQSWEVMYKSNEIENLPEEFNTGEIFVVFY